VRLIDLKHVGRESVIGCWQVGEALVDPGPSSCLETLLAELDGWRPRALLLTHIHLDHAGASGSLVRRWPELEVYVHARGARHMADPSRLLESARRLYGSDMGRLWGEFVAVPEQNLRVLEGDERIEVAGTAGVFEVAYTPGHASHHVSYLHDGTAFVGDVGGVRIIPNALTIPPTPPPDIDIEAWYESLQRVRNWRPERLAFTHFGAAEDVESQLDELAGRLERWGERARDLTRDAFIDMVRGEIALAATPGTPPAYEQAAPPAQLYAGLDRYWRKRDEASAAASGGTGSVS
jgi:glyoxylase-like metal-dependent hydrolase (beta-lactamase superfamily II)